MDEKTWVKTIVKVFKYYRIDKLPSDDQLKMWFDGVKFIPNHTIDVLINDLFNEHDTLPRNLPKALRQQYSKMPQTKRPVQYDPIEDTRYPVSMMHTAFNILETKGNVEFVKYCESTNMPRNDRDRVRYKYRIIREGQQPELMVKILTESIQQADEVPF